MGCGLSLVAPSNNGVSYRKLARPHPVRKGQVEDIPFTRANTLYVADDKRSKKAADDRKTESEKFLSETLNAHNEFRLTAHAQSWADELARKDMMIHSDCVLQGGEIVEENIYMCWSSGNQKPPGCSAVRSWYDEQSIFDYEKAKFSYKTGHFTQVVWRDTTYVGIAWARSSEGCNYVVANYSPAGNVHGTFEENVPPPVAIVTNEM